MPSAQPNRMRGAVKTSGSRPGAYISVGLGPGEHALVAASDDLTAPGDNVGRSCAGAHRRPGGCRRRRRRSSAGRPGRRSDRVHGPGRASPRDPSRPGRRPEGRYLIMRCRVPLPGTFIMCWRAAVYDSPVLAARPRIRRLRLRLAVITYLRVAGKPPSGTTATSRYREAARVRQTLCPGNRPALGASPGGSA